MRTPILDEIRVDGVSERGRVLVEFANVTLNMDPASARNVAFALMTQADRAEHPEGQ